MLGLCEIVAVATAAAAVATDLRARRIPNWLTASACLLGLGLNAALGGGDGALRALLGAGLGFALLAPFYQLRAIGAGDVKLLIAIGALVGPADLIKIALLGGIAGGIQALVVLAQSGFLVITLNQWLTLGVLPSFRTGARAPYAVAIGAGVCFLAVSTAVARHLPS
jgi:prepilin peptidase CpaA